MTIETVVNCDKCFASIWLERGDLTIQLTSQGWSVITDGTRHFCPCCTKSKKRGGAKKKKKVA